jgi:hypothetical protein
MDAVVQGAMAREDRRLVRGAGEKKRWNFPKSDGDEKEEDWHEGDRSRTPEAYGDVKLRA